MIDSTYRHAFQGLFDRIATIFIYFKILPNHVTVLALICGICSGLALANHMLLTALCFLLLSGLLDILDGTIARRTNHISPTGAYMDLIFDRMVEAAFILGFYFFAPEHTLAYFFFFIGSMFNFSTFMLAGSLYKNEGAKSMHYDVGLIERTETFICFLLMILLPKYSYLILTIFNILMFYTGISRMKRLISMNNKN